MKSEYLCTRCDSKWSYETEDKDALATCPICSFKDNNEHIIKIKELKNKLESYRSVFVDLGINNIQCKTKEI